jgi:nucleosome binding factor SPN SPT16 subunit
VKPFEDPDATFVRSLSYRTSDSSRFENLCTSINELKKEVTKRELQKKEMADVVDQDNIIEVKGRRPLRLQDVLLRPALDGKRLPGEIELHQNGLKYQALSSHKMGKHSVPDEFDILKHVSDLLYSNIKHVFFQPCENELVVIIHIHLKAPIMIGKKKSKVILQVVIETTRLDSFAITGCSVLQRGL